MHHYLLSFFLLAKNAYTLHAEIPALFSVETIVIVEVIDIKYPDFGHLTQ
jgi:hypothetical protein